MQAVYTERHNKVESTGISDYYMDEILWPDGNLQKIMENNGEKYCGTSPSR